MIENNNLSLTKYKSPKFTPKRVKFTRILFCVCSYKLFNVVNSRELRLSQLNSVMREIKKKENTHTHNKMNNLSPQKRETICKTGFTKLCIALIIKCVCVCVCLSVHI